MKLSRTRLINRIMRIGGGKYYKYIVGSITPYYGPNFLESPGRTKILVCQQAKRASSIRLSSLERKTKRLRLPTSIYFTKPQIKSELFQANKFLQLYFRSRKKAKSLKTKKISSQKKVKKLFWERSTEFFKAGKNLPPHQKK